VHFVKKISRRNRTIILNSKVYLWKNYFFINQSSRKSFFLNEKHFIVKYISDSLPFYIISNSENSYGLFKSNYSLFNSYLWRSKDVYNGLFLCTLGRTSASRGYKLFYECPNFFKTSFKSSRNLNGMHYIYKYTNFFRTNKYKFLIGTFKKYFRESRVFVDIYQSIWTYHENFPIIISKNLLLSNINYYFPLHYKNSMFRNYK